MVLPFWYQLTQAVLEKEPLNGCSVNIRLSQQYYRIIPSMFSKTTTLHYYIRLTALCLGLPVWARDSEWQRHQQICTSPQTDNHTSIPPLLQAGYPSCHPNNSLKAVKANCFLKPQLIPLLKPFYCPLDCVRDYPGEPVPERQNQEGKTNLDRLEQETASGSSISWACGNLHLTP